MGVTGSQGVYGQNQGSSCLGMGCGGRAGGKVMAGGNGRGEEGGAGLSGVEVGEKAPQDGS